MCVRAIAEAVVAELVVVWTAVTSIALLLSR